MAKKFNIVGIMKPGIINVLVNGKFRDVELFNAPDTVLEQLYEQKIPYVTLSESEYLKRNKDKKGIEVKKIKKS
jgi:hypothetical protein